MTSTETTIEKVVKMHVTELIEKTNVEKGLFADRLCSEIVVFANINYDLGIPLTIMAPGEKPRIGYRYGWFSEGDWDVPSRAGTEYAYPIRDTFLIEQNSYKILLRKNDNFKAIAEDIAENIVIAGGKEHIGIPSSDEPPEHKLDLTFESTDLETRIRRL